MVLMTFPSMLKGPFLQLSYCAKICKRSILNQRRGGGGGGGRGENNNFIDSKLCVCLFNFQIAGLFAVIWAVSLLGFLFSNYISIPEFASPLVLFGLCVLFLLNPFRIMYYKARWWLLRILVSTRHSIVVK